MRIMFKTIKRLHRTLYVASALITVSVFVASAFLFVEYPWVSNLLMGIGASFLASILFAVFSESTRKKYVILSAESKAKKETAVMYDKGILIGRREAMEEYKAGHYERAINWVGYFYEKISSTCAAFEGVQRYEGRLQQDKNINSFIAKSNKLYEEYLEIKEHLQEAEDKKAIAEEVLRNMEKCYALYSDMILSALHDATEIEMINNKYYFE